MGKTSDHRYGLPACDRCGHEWVPRDSPESEPRVCPKCKSPYWNKPRKIASATSYEDFRDKIVAIS